MSDKSNNIGSHDPVYGELYQGTYRKYGVYETNYGNDCEWEGGNEAYDLDMGEEISVDLIETDESGEWKWIREFDY
jgi:hypothetical protein